MGALGGVAAGGAREPGQKARLGVLRQDGAAVTVLLTDPAYATTAAAIAAGVDALPEVGEAIAVVRDGAAVI